MHEVVQLFGEMQTEETHGQAAGPCAAVVGIDPHAAVRGEQQARVRPIGLLRLVGNDVSGRECDQADLPRMTHARGRRAVEQLGGRESIRVSTGSSDSRPSRAAVPDSVIARPPV